MKKYIFLLFFLVIMLVFTSCSENSTVGSESTQISAEEESSTVKDEKESNEEFFSNDITTETVESPNVREYSETENGANIEESYDIITNVSETETSQEITESETMSEDTETRFNPFFGDINEYAGKEVSFAVFYFIRRYPLSYREEGKDFSVLYVFSDGTCRAEVFTNKDYFTTFSDTDKFSFDEINEPIIVLSEELEALDSDTIKNINTLIRQIDFENEYIDHDPDSRNPDIEHPAFDPDYDIVDFYAADKEGNLHRILYDYVFPDRFEELGFGSVQIELNDEYAKHASEVLTDSYIVKYWLENYAWKIGE